MSRQDVLRGVVADKSKRPAASINTATRLAEDLGLRSLQRIELAVLLEQKLGMPVSDDVVMTAKTIGDLERTLGV